MTIIFWLWHAFITVKLCFNFDKLISKKQYGAGREIWTPVPLRERALWLIISRRAPYQARRPRHMSYDRFVWENLIIYCVTWNYKKLLPNVNCDWFFYFDSKRINSIYINFVKTFNYWKTVIFHLIPNKFNFFSWV